MRITVPSADMPVVVGVGEGPIFLVGRRGAQDPQDRSYDRWRAARRDGAGWHPRRIAGITGDVARTRDSAQLSTTRAAGARTTRIPGPLRRAEVASAANHPTRPRPDATSTRRDLDADVDRSAPAVLRDRLDRAPTLQVVPASGPSGQPQLRGPACDSGRGRIERQDEVVAIVIVDIS